MAGFEPTTSAPPERRADQATLHPDHRNAQGIEPWRRELLYLTANTKASFVAVSNRQDTSPLLRIERNYLPIRFEKFRYVKARTGIEPV
jgi:hypothetical protein